MGRVLLLSLSEAEATKTCGDLGVGISVLEPLVSGGVRLVCVTSDGAARARHKLRTKLIDGPVKRSPVFSRGMQPTPAAKPDDPRPKSVYGERNSR
jgi:hypothetical protein